MNDEERRCRTCRHFGEVGKDWCPLCPEGPPREYGRCALVASMDSKKIVPASLAHAQDADSYSAWLVVAPEFGCVQWEGIEATNSPVEENKL